MLPLITPGGQVTDNDNSQFLSFAKSSRTVWRSYEAQRFPTPAPFWRTSVWYNEHPGFSERPVLHLSPHNIFRTDNFPDVSSDMAGCVTSRKPLPFQRLPWSPTKLPTPSELMGRRRKGGKQGGVGGLKGSDGTQHKAAVVLHHIRDLKKRQSVIDKLKTERWWGSADCKNNLEDSWSPMDGCLLPPSDPQSATGWDPHSPTPTRVPQGLYDREVMFGRWEAALNLAPGANPMMSFVMATADRQDHGSYNIPYWSHKGSDTTESNDSLQYSILK